MPLDQAQAAFEKALATDQNVEQRKEHIRHGMTWLMEAAQGDPWDELPLHELAQRRWREWLEHPSEDREEAFLLAYGHWMAVARGSASLHKLAGDWFLQAHARPDTAEMQPPPIQRAVDEYRKAVKLYPNSSLFRAQLAWAENLAGNRQEARAAAEEALRLDALNPHADRRLGYPLVRISGDPQVKEVPPLELMQRILRIDAPSPSPLK
jgi:tetratricopeptide (TPR) repeat protein